jgi:Rps23 Pro-64 3,4-dihydroxylase Tpa1-like proline 4-hydroxylase
MNIDEVLSLSEIDYYSSPFDYFTAAEMFSNGFGFELLNWLETYNSWKLVEKDFYEQYEFSLLDVQLPKSLAFFQQPSALQTIKSKIENIFQIKLSAKIDFSVHKLVAGQRIRIHNDFIPGQESYRLLIQLNRGWNEENGGLLLLFNSDDPADIHKIIMPVHNSALAFKISPNSNHAVSTVYEGGRFTLVYSFYDAEK